MKVAVVVRLCQKILPALAQQGNGKEQCICSLALDLEQVSVLREDKMGERLCPRLEVQWC
jgi:hypothetical protein